MNGEPITYELLRSRGFRLDSSHVDNKPHMVIRLKESRYESFIEISKSVMAGWAVWLRSDLAHSRCRFIYVRDVESSEQLERLYQGLTDHALPTEPFDAERFSLVMAREKAECQLRYQEYAAKERYGYVP
jgi:hypothetical protein